MSAAARADALDVTPRMAAVLAAADRGRVRLTRVGDLSYDRAVLHPQSLRACLARGLLDRNAARGVVSLTERGRAALAAR